MSPHHWKKSFSANPSSSSRCWKSMQKCKRTLWPWGFSGCKSCSRYPFTRRRLRRIGQTLDRGICSSRVARCVDFWGLLANVSRTRPTISANGPGRPVNFSEHMQPLCWNFMYHSRIVLSVGGSVWYMVRSLHYTTDSVLANSKTQNAFLFPVHTMFPHDCPLAVKPASMPRRLVHEKTWRDKILYLLICSFLLCLSWLLRSQVLKFWSDWWFILYNYI